ncbi:MAG: hemerythrin family protein [Treponema sp.]|jgi:hemerythrin|nr:hemerythrin family protein [Treponema sp.]
MYYWDKSLEVGNQMIDEQHKQLIDALNSFLNARTGQKSNSELKKSLDFLNDYTIKHFYEEERLQKKYEYPDYENHKKLHEGLKKVVRELQTQLIMKGPSDALFDDVQIKVGDWLIAHIKSQDVKIGAHLKSKGVV